jgi:hypothetical protein
LKGINALAVIDLEVNRLALLTGATPEEGFDSIPVIYLGAAATIALI